VWTEGEDISKQRRLDDGKVRIPAPTEDGGFPLLDEEGGVQVIDSAANLRVTGTSCVIDSLEQQLQSTLIFKEVWECYLEQLEKLKRDLKTSSQEDNRWLLRTVDFNGNGIVKIFCVECRKEIGGDNGKHEKSNIQNLFNNYRCKHLLHSHSVMLLTTRLHIFFPLQCYVKLPLSLNDSVV